MAEQYKRNIAYKLRIISLIEGKPILENDRLKHLELNNKQVVRVNIAANIIEKYIQEGEKKYATITLDDGSGQIKVKFFGEEVDKLIQYNQGDTILVIGVLRSWNNEIYITSEVIKKKDASYLLLRKFEIEAEMPKITNQANLSELKDKLLFMIKESEKEGGVDIDRMILEIKEHPEIINQEIKKLLEDGVIYEPRPGKLRWLG